MMPSTPHPPQEDVEINAILIVGVVRRAANAGMLHVRGLLYHAAAALPLEPEVPGAFS